MNVARRITGAIFPQLMYLGKAAAGLGLIGMKLKTAEVRPLGRRLRLRLDKNAALGRQGQPQREEPQRVIHARVRQANALLPSVAGIHEQICALQAAELNLMHGLLAAERVCNGQTHAAKGNRQPRAVRRCEAIARLLRAHTALRQRGAKACAAHGGQADQKREHRQRKRKGQQIQRKPAGIKAVEQHGGEQIRAVEQAVFDHDVRVWARASGEEGRVEAAPR